MAHSGRLGRKEWGSAWVQREVVRPERFELPTFWFVARRSIQLSYERTRTLFTINRLARFLLQFQPRVCMHSHPINSKWLSRNCLRVRASSAVARRSIQVSYRRVTVSNSLLKRLQQLHSSTSAAIFGTFGTTEGV